ncbi:unnamed protein product [Zymoseptoria tritici ST99CH_3D7]|uniref:Uncharacterized protein n=1 Tax=Zymoseptoria tritici (strain ST99CH_3D7) TaxID=1276538 RepID=A0A1X7S8X7_ZYMT9|nr:unnamed protein product [Zymoseptoria tritici ST99CH_3D7]
MVRNSSAVWYPAPSSSSDAHKAKSRASKLLSAALQIAPFWKSVPEHYGHEAVVVGGPLPLYDVFCAT